MMIMACIASAVLLVLTWVLCCALRAEGEEGERKPKKPKEDKNKHQTHVVNMQDN